MDALLTTWAGLGLVGLVILILGAATFWQPWGRRLRLFMPRPWGWRRRPFGPRPWGWRRRWW